MFFTPKTIKRGREDFLLILATIPLWPGFSLTEIKGY
jgi:hypothetical protein